MGKVSNRSPLVSPRRRVLKASSGVGVKKNRGSSAAKANLSAPPPPIQSLVDEDSGFGGDQSLDSESSLLSAPGNSSNPGVASISSVLPSLAMVPQTKLLLVSLLQGAGGGEKGNGNGQKNNNPPGNVAVGAFAPTTQLTVSNGTSQTGNTRGAVTTSSGADKEWHIPHHHQHHSVPGPGPLVAGAAPAGSFSLQGATAAAAAAVSSTEVVSELPSVSSTTNSPPSNYPTTGTVPLGNTSHKGVYNQVNVAGNKLPIDVSGEEAQELPGSLGCKNSRQMPPLISFRDVSLLSSLYPIRNTNNSGTPSVVRVEAAPQPTGRSKKLLRQSAANQNPPSLTAQLSARSSDGSIELKLVNQPEEQHRARYQTEGSRGAVKDEDGKGHPTIKLTGYAKPTVVQVFVGDDSVRTSPHMFYQVCRVSGKNSTPCKEKHIDGTAVIEALLEPNSDMMMSCDCVGILKERNVDVEHRFKSAVSRGRKKSTKCRLVFRTFVTLPNGVQETLQVVSRPIACTQPPGVPEICRKSRSSCSASGGEEIFIFGKNFSKDTTVIFQETGAKSQPVWEQTVIPEKETLQPIHLIVAVPKYYDETITEEVTVQMIVSSGSKMSEPHNFTYLPIVSKKELQGQEVPEEQPLPKGVSLGALQLNRHYTETRMLPSALQEVSTTGKSSSTPMKITSVPSSKSTASSVRVPRIVQGPAQSRKAAGRSQRAASQISKTSVVINKVVGSAGGVNTKQISSISGSQANSKIKLEKEEEKKKVPEQEQKQENAKGTVSLGSLVELLHVVQSLPAGSIEELVRSMKENITTPATSKSQTSQESLDSTGEKGVVNSLSTLNILQGKVQKNLPQTSIVVSQEGTANKIVPTVTTNLGLWPLTLFPSVSTSQSLVGGPRVARVAPIASTTVVSSPGLARTVRVCVAEAPNISLEPPKKKPCDHLATMDYELVERNQLVSEPVVNSGAMPAPITTSSEITYNTTGQPVSRDPISSQCDTQSNNTVPPTTSVAQEQTFIHPTSQIVTEASPVLATDVQTTLNAAPQQQPLYQTMSPILQSISHATQQVNQPLNVSVALNQTTDINQPLNVSLGQTIQQVRHPLNVSLSHTTQEAGQPLAVTLNQNIQERSQPLNVSCLASAPEVNQVVIKAEPAQVIGQCANPQELNLTPAVPTSIAGAVATPPLPLFNRSAELGTSQIVETNHAVISSTASNPAPVLAPQSVVTSALTHSDPLLSQSVAPMQLDQGTAAQAPSRNQPAIEARSRAEVLMTPSSSATQVSMQNEVTSAINLSEAEFLNYFDPNCFDNV